MTDSHTAIQELLTAALRAAAVVAQERVGRPVQVAAGEQPSSQALLRFDVKFDDVATLSWFVTNEDATGFSDMLIGGAGDRGAVLTEMHLDALSSAFSDMLERAVDGLSASLTQPLPAGTVDMGMETAVPEPEQGAASLLLALVIEGFGPVGVVQRANPALVAMIDQRLPADGVPAAAAPTAAPAAAAPNAFEASGAGSPVDNVVPLPNFTNQATQQARPDLSMLMNVPLEVTVELGRTQRTVRDILDLNVGSIVELAKLAGDPMDIMVNGKVLARGEVVVIDEEFGIRVTEILSPEQRLRHLG